MKNLFLLFFAILIFTTSNNIFAQEDNSYLNVIASSIPDKYVKSDLVLFFTVQVAALKNKNESLENIKNIMVSNNEEDNLTKYRLGKFSSYEQAVDFKKIVLNFCNDAFIVPIRDGKRIHIKEALKEIVPIL